MSILHIGRLCLTHERSWITSVTEKDQTLVGWRYSYQNQCKQSKHSGQEKVAHVLQALNPCSSGLSSSKHLVHFCSHSFQHRITSITAFHLTHNYTFVSLLQYFAAYRDWSPIFQRLPFVLHLFPLASPFSPLTKVHTTVIHYPTSPSSRQLRMAALQQVTV